MGYSTVLFDLDGTLTDSGEGIMNSATYALKKMGLTVPPREELRIFVGPPLAKTFADFGLMDEQVDEAIKAFREVYNVTGKFENVPYEGIEEMLQTLQAEGMQLFVATSKPEVVAKEVLHKFGLDKYFEEIAGATFDHSRETKTAVLEYLLEKNEILDAVMVGDTDFDVIGAREVGLPCVGVTWGYGNEASMMQAGAVQIVKTISELSEFLRKK